MTTKACRVIVNCFLNGRDERNNSPLTTSECLQMIKNVVNVERAIPSETNYDLIIINHQTGFEVGDEYLNSLNNEPTKNGKIIVVNTENKGLSMDGYNTAFEMFQKDYDYWIFSEDDHILFAENYYDKLIEEFESLDNIGFLALAPKSKDLTIEHSGGGFGLAETKSLKKIYDKFGKLPCLETHKTRTAAEIFFTNAFAQIGLNIVENKTYCLAPINVHQCQDHMINFKGNENDLPFLFKVGL